MVLSYKELIDLFGNDYQIKKKIFNKELIKICDGFYTPGEYTPIELIVKKYENSVFTFLTGLYFQGMIKEIPEIYYLASKKETTRIRNPLIHQYFIDQKRLYEYVDIIMRDGIQLMVYSKEKLLISLIKHRNQVSSSLYHEAIVNYRKIKLNMRAINLLLNREPHKEKIREILIKEVL